MDDDLDLVFDESITPDEVLRRAARLTQEAGAALMYCRSPQELANISDALTQLAHVVDSTNLRLMIRE